jgi:hypothetical protein
MSLFDWFSAGLKELLIGLPVLVISKPSYFVCNSFLDCNPSMVSGIAVFRSLLARVFEKASVVPSSRLMLGRSTSATWFFGRWQCRTRCFIKLESAADLRRTVEGAAFSISRMMRSQAMTARDGPSSSTAYAVLGTSRPAGTSMRRTTMRALFGLPQHR